MITKREQEERKEIMENALASVRLEGLEPDAKAIIDSERRSVTVSAIRDHLLIKVPRTPNVGIYLTY